VIRSSMSEEISLWADWNGTTTTDDPRGAWALATEIAPAPTKAQATCANPTDAVMRSMAKVQPILRGGRNGRQ